MRRATKKSRTFSKKNWASIISDLRRKMDLSQTAFGQRLHSSAMAISRWERGAQEPSAERYIELGNMAGDPLCWYFWGRAGLSNEDLMRVMPMLRRRLASSQKNDFQIARAGGGHRKDKIPQLVAIPLVRVTAASHGEKGDDPSILQNAPVETMIAAPSEWCPNPSATTCIRVQGNSMSPLIHDGYILAVDSSQHDHAKLSGKVVIAWHKDRGLTVSRLRRYGATEVLEPENRDYEAVVLDNKEKWIILAKVLWWIGRAV